MAASDVGRSTRGEGETTIINHSLVMGDGDGDGVGVGVGVDVS